MLPFPERFNGIDLYKATNWPSGLRPNQLLLDGRRQVQSMLAAADGRFFQITGTNCSTVTNLKIDHDGQFAYVQTLDGDGTVPVDLAALSNMSSYFVQETHNGLLGNRKVAEAVGDILSDGHPSVLPGSPPHQRRGVLDTTSVTDADLASYAPFGGREGEAVTEYERRQILGSLLSKRPADEARRASSFSLAGGPLAPAAYPTRGRCCGPASAAPAGHRACEWEHCRCRRVSLCIGYLQKRHTNGARPTNSTKRWVA